MGSTLSRGSIRNATIPVVSKTTTTAFEARESIRSSLWSRKKFHFFSSKWLLCRCRRCVLCGSGEGEERAETLGVSINWLNQDLLDGWKLPSASYSLIIMFRFVALELLPVLPEILERGGSLVIEEHLQWKGEAVSGPTNDNFRVPPGELARIVDGLKVVYEYEGLVTEPDGALAALSQLHLIK